MGDLLGERCQNCRSRRKCDGHCQEKEAFGHYGAYQGPNKQACWKFNDECKEEVYCPDKKRGLFGRK